jgi:hypothetical protein
VSEGWEWPAGKEILWLKARTGSCGLSRLLTFHVRIQIMICQACRKEAPTKFVAFYRTIGFLKWHFWKSIEGELCKSCIHKHYWQYTLVDLTLGWWGFTSLIVTPFYILNNTARYLFCLGMAPVPRDAAPPRLTEDSAERIKPYLPDLIDRRRTETSLPTLLRKWPIAPA